MNLACFSVDHHIRSGDQMCMGLRGDQTAWHDHMLQEEDWKGEGQQTRGSRGGAVESPQ